MSENNNIENTQQQLIIEALLKDRKSDRRWRNFRFFVWLIIALIILAMIIALCFGSSTKTNAQPYVSLVRLDGIIMPGTNFSAQKVLPQLNDAFKDKNAKGVVLLINSPGGSPVQASIIHDKIEQLKQQYHKKVIIVGEDTLASGAYLVATAGDKIYVNRDTLTGSIGVIMDGFGLNDAIGKLGITRRVFTAGANKDRLDPFKPLNPSDEVKVKQVLDQVHQSFIADVENGRGNKLGADKQEIFSGDFWTGDQAVKLGLADGTANLWTVLQKEFSVKYYSDYTRKSSFVQMLLEGVDSELNLGLHDQNSPIKAELMKMS